MFSLRRSATVTIAMLLAGTMSLGSIASAFAQDGPRGDRRHYGDHRRGQGDDNRQQAAPAQGAPVQAAPQVQQPRRDWGGRNQNADRQQWREQRQQQRVERGEGRREERRNFDGRNRGDLAQQERRQFERRNRGDVAPQQVPQQVQPQDSRQFERRDFNRGGAERRDFTQRDFNRGDTLRQRQFTQGDQRRGDRRDWQRRYEGRDDQRRFDGRNEQRRFDGRGDQRRFDRGDRRGDNQFARDNWRWRGDRRWDGPRRHVNARPHRPPHYRSQYLPRHRWYRDIYISRPYGWAYPGFGYYYSDADAFPFLGLAALSFIALNNLNEMQQRAHEAAFIEATQADIGERIYWEEDGLEGSVTAVRDGETPDGRPCREFQQEVIIGGRPEQAYGTACMQPDGSWQVVNEQY